MFGLRWLARHRYVHKRVDEIIAIELGRVWPELTRYQAMVLRRWARLKADRAVMLAARNPARDLPFEHQVEFEVIEPVRRLLGDAVRELLECNPHVRSPLDIEV